MALPDTTPSDDSVGLAPTESGPQFVGRTPRQQRGTLHAHGLIWLQPFYTNGPDDHSASIRAYAAGYCHKHSPIKHRRGGAEHALTYAASVNNVCFDIGM